MKQFEFDIKVLDAFLKMFDEENKFISYETIAKNTPPSIAYEDYVFAVLVEEGLLKQNKYGYEITAKGLMFRNKGGFAAVRRRERYDRAITIVTTVSSVIAALTGILSLCLN
jgi:hypothetical protein